MIETLRLFGRYLGITVRGQMQYRASFVMQTLGQLGVSGIEFFAVWALFHRFNRLGPWSLPEVGMFYGTVGMAWALADTVGRCFDNFGPLVKSGDFDRMLLRPRSTIFQLLAQDVQLRRLGRMAQAIAVLIWSITTLDIAWTPAHSLGLLATIAGGALLFLGLLIVQATIAFWTIESLEIMNVMTYGGVTTAQYPLSIYPATLRRFFLFVVPLGLTLYLPVVGLLGKADPLGFPPWMSIGGPLAGVAFFVASLGIWQIGLRHYTSTGS